MIIWIWIIYTINWDLIANFLNSNCLVKCYWQALLLMDAIQNIMIKFLVQTILCCFCFSCICSSFCSTLMDIESTASSGRSTPAMLNGHSGGAAAVAGSGPAVSKSLNYTCCWDDCQLLFSSSPDLAEHIRAMHVDGQRGGVSLFDLDAAGSW